MGWRLCDATLMKDTPEHLVLCAGMDSTLVKEM